MLARTASGVQDYARPDDESPRRDRGRHQRSHPILGTRRLRLATLSDLELLAEVVDGDEIAWRVFMGRFRGLIQSCCAKSAAEAGYFLQADDIAEVASEVAVRLVSDGYRRLRAYRPDGGASVATWVGVIASSTAKDFVRKLRRQQLDLVSETELERVVCDAPGPVEQLESKRRWEYVATQLEALSSRDREFVAHYFRDARSPEEIADFMGISVSTVYSKKAKISRRLALLAAQGW